MKLRHALFATAMLAAAPAHAATYQITFTGTVINSYDFDAFGTHDGLEGKDFTAIYTLTAPFPGAITYDDGFRAYIAGGSDLGVPAPVSAALTINGITVSFLGEHYGFAQQIDDLHGSIYRIDQIALQVHRYDLGLNIISNYIESNFNNIIDENNFSNQINYLVKGDDNASGWFHYEKNSNTAFGDLRANHVTIARLGAAAVPEPATWALMLLGFGVIGAAMRGRRRTGVRFAF